MRRAYLLGFVLVCMAAVSLITFTKAVCEDDDSSCDTLYDNNGIFSYGELFENALSQNGIFYEYGTDNILRRSFISYLARYEKSPPGHAINS